MRKLPTDYDIFNAIYDRYYKEFAGFTESHSGRRTKNYVPIDIGSLARQLGVDGDIVFGRLYYLHRRKYSYDEVDGNGKKISVPFFEMAIGGDRHAIHFPLMAAALSDLRKEEKRNKSAVRFSLAALVIALTSLIVNIFT